MIRQLLSERVPPPGRLVELGAAPGAQSLALAAAGYCVTAVDLGAAEWSGGSAGSMASRLEEAGIDLVLWDLEQSPYPFPEESFDAVLLTEVLEHLRDYPVRALEEVRRILVPGGVLVLTTPNAAYLRKRLALVLGRSVYSPLPDWTWGEPHARHAREYTRSELEWLLAHVGLETVFVTGRHFYRGSGRIGKVWGLAKTVVDATARLAPTLGPSLVVVARRPPTD